MPNVLVPYDFTPRSYQLPVLKALDSGKKYACIVWARRHGKDLLCWNYAIKRAAETPLDVTYVYPTNEMAKNNLWEAKTNDGREFTDYIPQALRMRSHQRDDGLNDTFKQVQLVNNSIIRLASAERPDRLRGGNSKLYILSEFAEMDPTVFDVIEPIVEANGGQVLVNFTPKGDNHAKAAFDVWRQDPEWFTQIITARDTDVFSSDQLDRIKERVIDRFRQQGRSEAEAHSFFDQEYMCSFESPVIGSYYGEGMRRAQAEGRITSVPWEPTLKVHTYWDIGVRDSTSIWFLQTVGREIHIIDYLESSGEGLPYYASELNKKPYSYGEHWGPHDIEVRELGTGKSRREVAKSLGINFRITPNLSIEDGIEAARNLIPKCWFDAVKCERGISGLKSYRKDWDEKNKVFKNHPNHDWSSHPADAFRYLAVAFKQPTTAEPYFNPAYR